MQRPALVLALFCLAPGAFAQVGLSAYVNFEGAQTSPIRLSRDGTRLFAVNTPDARLSVFSLTDPSNPSLIAEIPVGIEPVSVNPRTNDEAWVVNQESDSISVVSVSKGMVTDTIYVKDEPADVVFVGAKAFVSVARSNQVRVYNASTHALVKTIPLFGLYPRSLAVNAGGTKVYVAFGLSGNRTTLVSFASAPPQSPPTNPALPAPPPVGLIVDAADPSWASAIPYTMPDNDVAEIDVATLAISRYFSRVGTLNFGLAIRPGTGDIFVTNTDANNLVHFEPNLNGKFINSRITKIDSLGTVTPVDLNPTPSLATAVSQPTAAIFDPTGQFMYVASFGTDRIALVDTNGSITTRIELSGSPTAIDPRHKRGPRGLALKGGSQRLYVLNRISNTISVVNTGQRKVIREIPTGSFDPTPQVIRDGRGFLYDARLSGNGNAACAGCHVDADMDMIAWDLGDPGGDMASVVAGGRTFSLHPMKGPMTTQTLRGLSDLAPFHWRGDRANFQAFNPAFGSLMAGTPLSDPDMQAYTDFVMTMRFMPNPYRNLDDTLPLSIQNGDPTAGFNTFHNEEYNPGNKCGNCHTADPGPGSSLLIFDQNLPQPFKVPQLRNEYQKVFFTNTGVRDPSNQTLSGFGELHDGQAYGLVAFLSNTRFGVFANDPVRKRNLRAFVMCFDTGMPPATGYTRTLTASSAGTGASDWSLLESQAAASRIDLVVKGTLGGTLHGLVYQPGSNNYLTDLPGLGPFTHTQLLGYLQAGDTLTLMGVPAGTGVRMGIDRNLNGVLDGLDPIH